MDNTNGRSEKAGARRPDTRTHPKLPVTGEIGSEGGSYADQTLQVAEFEGDVGYLAQDSEPEKIESGPADVLKYPNER